MNLYQLGKVEIKQFHFYITSLKYTVLGNVNATSTQIILKGRTGITSVSDVVNLHWFAYGDLLFFKVNVTNERQKYANAIRTKFFPQIL